MTTLVSSFIGTAVKTMIFAGIAYAGIVCGKKYKDKKVASQAGGSQEGK